MKVKSTCVMLSVLTVGAVAWTGMAGGQVHWGYEGKSGPQYWGDLEPKFRLCSAGKNQSPIDLANFVEADLKPIRFAYKAGSQEILNNGHTVQVNYAAGSSITTEGRVFELKQFHFHAPSENKINGKQFTLEAHLVHADKDDNLAVVAVMFEMGRANSLLAKLWQKIPGNAGDKAATVGHDVLRYSSQGARLLPLQRLPHHAAVFRRGLVARDEDPGDGIEGAS